MPLASSSETAPIANASEEADAGDDRQHETQQAYGNPTQAVVAQQLTAVACSDKGHTGCQHRRDPRHVLLALHGERVQPRSLRIRPDRARGYALSSVRPSGGAARYSGKEMYVPTITAAQSSRAITISSPAR